MLVGYIVRVYRTFIRYTIFIRLHLIHSQCTYSRISDYYRYYHSPYGPRSCVMRWAVHFYFGKARTRRDLIKRQQVNFSSRPISNVATAIRRHWLYQRSCSPQPRTGVLVQHCWSFPYDFFELASCGKHRSSVGLRSYSNGTTSFRAPTAAVGYYNFRRRTRRHVFVM